MTAQDLRQWREDLGLSRKQAAAALGCSWRSVEAWEQGRKIPAGRVKLIHFMTTGYVDFMLKNKEVGK